MISTTQFAKRRRQTRAAQGATVLQLFPYGWTWQDIKTPCREELTLHMVLAARCTYTRWTNKRPENAFLRKCGSTDKFFSVNTSLANTET